MSLFDTALHIKKIPISRTKQKCNFSLLSSDRYAGIASLDEENEEEKWAERTELITKYGELLLRTLSFLVFSLFLLPPFVLFSCYFLNAR